MVQPRIQLTEEQADILRRRAQKGNPPGTCVDEVLGNGWRREGRAPRRAWFARWGGRGWGNPATGPAGRQRTCRAEPASIGWECYEKGQLARVEEDTDRDGRVDRWSTHEEGILISTAVDANKDGQPDVAPRP